MSARRGGACALRRRRRSFRKCSTHLLIQLMLIDIITSLCADIIRSFLHLDEESQQRNIIAWRPVVVDVMEGYTTFPADTFEKHIATFYPICVDLLSRDLNADVRLALQAMLRRVGECKLGIAPRPVERRGSKA